MGKENKNNNITRKDFLRTLGGVAAASSLAFYGCGPVSKPSTVKNMSGEPSGKMTYRINHNTKDKVSLLGYGCMRLPMLTPTGEGDGEIDQKTVNELVDYAIAHGVNYFDTSPVYVKGMSEHSTGIALSRYPREKYYVATKMSTFDPKTRTREASIDMYHNSFKELKVDYIDYYLLHAIGKGMDDFKERFIDNGILDFLLNERKAGRIRNLGWSFHGEQEVFDYVLSMGVKWDFVQIQLNYVDWQHATAKNVNAKYLYEKLVEHNIPAIVMEPILGGRLAKLDNYLTTSLKQEQPQVSIASWAFRFAGSLPNVLTVLSGMTYKEHLQDNLCTYSPLHSVNDHEKEILEGVAQMMEKRSTIPCTGCKYCMPCPYGLDIPAVFAHYNRCINEGNIPQGLQNDNYRRARRIFLVGYDRSVPRLRQANHCVGCGQCIPACPQGINIPEKMRMIDKFVEHLKRESTTI